MTPHTEERRQIVGIQGERHDDARAAPGIYSRKQAIWTEAGAVRHAENIAGSLLAPMFIRGGWDAVQNPESKVKSAEAVTKALSARLSFVPDDPAVLVRLNGAVQVGAGALLATGPFRRLAALVLIGSLIPTTYAGHAFWNEIDEQKRAFQQIQFWKNTAMLGGLVLIAAGQRKRTRRAAH